MIYNFDAIVSESSDMFYEYVENNIFVDDNQSNYPMTYEEAISFDALYDSMRKCRRGVMWKTSVVGYLEHSINNISKLENKLISGEYEPRKTFHFIVYSPKKRDIVAVHFEDRLIQRSFNDNIIYPIMTKSFVDSNCACQKNKGTEYGINLLKKYLYRCYKQENNNDFYVLQIDIKGYYPNMRHSYIEELFKKSLDPLTYSFVEYTMRSQYPGDVGYNPGSQLIQIAGISCLNTIDHWFKEDEHCLFYIRYMDDIIVLSRDVEFLNTLLYNFIDKLKELGFSCNKNKTKIYHQRDYIQFLGFNFFITDSGKIIQLINPETLKRDYKHWKNMTLSIINGKYELLTVNKLIDSIDSTINYVKKSNSFKLRNKLNQRKKKLLEMININKGGQVNAKY